MFFVLRLCLKVARAKKLFIAINVIGEFEILNTHFKKPDIQVQQTNDVMQKQDMNQRQIVDLIMEKGNEHHGFGELRERTKLVLLIQSQCRSIQSFHVSRHSLKAPIDQAVILP